MSNPKAVRISGPLTMYVEGFCDELAGQGYVLETACVQLRLMAHLSGWLESAGLDGGSLTPARLEDFLRVRRAAGCRELVSQRGLVPLMTYLTGLGVVAPPPAAMPTANDLVVSDYRRHLVIDRGLAPSTVDHYIDVAQKVLAQWGDQGLELATVTAGEVTAFVVGVSRRGNVPTAKALVTALRSWLRFLAAEGLTSQDLVGAVPAVASWRGGWIPRGLSDAEVAALLASIDPTTPVGLRDRAVLIVLARLALRAGEVAALVLDDVDWRRGELVVSGKGSRRDRLPLPVDVGEAMATYVHDGRRRVSCRALFLRAHAPITGLSSSAVSAIVAGAGKRAGVTASAHRLRHSAATAMLRAGGSLSEVGQVLRHGDVATTAIYAKVDHQALRTLALRWPGRTA
jgi:site-specific recombinase XerD